LVFVPKLLFKKYYDQIKKKGDTCSVGERRQMHTKLITLKNFAWTRDNIKTNLKDIVREDVERIRLVQMSNSELL
jgi:hypothetical protein